MKAITRWTLLMLAALAAPSTWAKNYTVSVGGVVNNGGYYGGTTDVLMFQPANLTIQAGDTVTFTNMGGTHNVASDTPGLFRCANGCDGTGGNGSPAGDNWSVTIQFNTAGTFGYHCDLHVNMGMRGTITVNPAPQAAFTITPGITGSWYNPNQSGHGFNLEVLPGNIFLAYWYLFDPSGNNLWLGGISNGAFSGNSATVNLTQTTGGSYPPLDPTKIVRTAWGTLTFTFSDCNNGTATWTPSIGGFASGTMPIKRLTGASGIACP